MRVLLHDALRSCYPHESENIKYLVPESGLIIDVLVKGYDLAELRPDREDRVERRGRILEYHRYQTTPDASHLFWCKLGELDALEFDGARGDLPWVRTKPQYREGGHALAAASLTDYPDGFVLVDGEVDAIEGGHCPLPQNELGPQSFDFYDRFPLRGHRLIPFMRGSRTSRRPSPRRLKPRTVISSTTPGKVAIHHASPMKGIPRL